MDNGDGVDPQKNRDDNEDNGEGEEDELLHIQYNEHIERMYL